MASEPNLRITPPPDSATGAASIQKSLEVAWRDTGPLRAFQLFSTVNQKSGFDCPSCAWPDPRGERHTFEFCENGVKAFADEATRSSIGRDFFARHSVAELAARSDHWLNAQGRLAEPLVLRPGATHYAPLSWQEAFALAGQALRELASPDQAIFYTSGRTSNEAAFLYQLFVRRFGTNNLPDCSNMCHESSGVGLESTIGVGKSTVTLEDLEHAGCILLIGQNPATNHPRMLSSLQTAVRNGAKVISINPLPEVGLMRFKHPQELRGLLGPGTALTSLFLQVRVNGDVALLKALAKVILESGRGVDRDFIGQYTAGFEEFAAALAAHSLTALSEQAGISEAQIREAAAIIAEAPGVICCWAMGLTQHQNAVDNIRELVNLMLLGGNVGKPHAGFFCVRGHSNVQGDRTMGIYEKPSSHFLARLGAEFDFVPPAHHGYDTVAAIEAMHAGVAPVFVAMGGNFLSAAPDTGYTAAALRRCHLTVQISTKLNRSHLVTGRTALILPCLGRTDQDHGQFVTTESSLSDVAKSAGVVPPVSPHLKSEVAIVCGLAQATLDLDWSAYAADYGLIRQHIARVIPGCENYAERVEVPGGFCMDIPPKRRIFPTSSGKAHFSVTSLRPVELAPGEYLMMTIRSHDQFNTTVYGLDDRYRGVFQGRRIVLMNAHDIAGGGFAPGQQVDLRHQHRVAEDFILVPYDIPRGSIATYFPEANVLIPIDRLAGESRTPASKSTPVTIHRR
ncbi:MAG: FdhF/YdeP family oxidoreductase [Bryobacteraceae bacterium]|nr:FdhF/YdeP family oxidoreductase [Bryobacteraceae bacterium]